MTVRPSVCLKIMNFSTATQYRRLKSYMKIPQYIVYSVRWSVMHSSKDIYVYISYKDFVILFFSSLLFKTHHSLFHSLPHLLTENVTFIVSAISPLFVNQFGRCFAT